MAGRVTITGDIDVSQILSAIGQVKSAIKNINFDSTLGMRLREAFINAQKEADKLNKKVESGFKTNADIEQANTVMDRMIKSLQRIKELTGKVTFDDLYKTADVKKDIEQVNIEIDNLKRNLTKTKQESLEDLLKVDGFKKAMNAAKIDYKDLISPEKAQAELRKVSKATNEAVDTIQGKLESLKSIGKALEGAATSASKPAKTLDEILAGASTSNGKSFKADGFFKVKQELKDLYNIDLPMPKGTLQQVKDFISQITDPFANIQNTPAKSIEQIFKDASNAAENAFKSGGLAQAQAELKKFYNLDAPKGSLAQLKQWFTDLGATMTPSLERVQQEITKLTQDLDALKNVSSNVEAGQQMMDNALKAPNVEETKSKIEGLKVKLETIRAEYLKNAFSADKLNDAFRATGEATDKAAEGIGSVNKKLEDSKAQTAMINNLDSFVKRWISVRMVFYQVKNLVKDMVSQIKELDQIMTGIAVVTDMDLGDLWSQIDTYMSVAKQYGVTTKGVYEVSQLYYQMGLKQSEVTSLTAETLKLSKISNLDYAASTDLMTVALKGFNIEASDANRITDVYSRLAAITASDVSELATAMSKTASGAASVGSSFENTSAFLAQMIETTR